MLLPPVVLHNLLDCDVTVPANVRIPTPVYLHFPPSGASLPICSRYRRISFARDRDIVPELVLFHPSSSCNSLSFRYVVCVVEHPVLLLEGLGALFFSNTIER